MSHVVSFKHPFLTLGAFSWEEIKPKPCKGFMACCSTGVPNHVQKHVVGLNSIGAFREESIDQWVQDKKG